MTHHEIPYRNMNEYEFRYQEEILRQILLEKFLQAMREDLSEWLSSLSHHVSVSADNFLNDLEDGIILCQHARLIQRYAEEYAVVNSSQNVKIPSKTVFYKERGAFPGSFIARDNVANFITWCRELGIPDVVIFESEDLVLQKNEKSVILTLMEVARKAYIFGVQPPEIVRFEKEIDEEIDKEKEAVLLGKPPQKPRDLEEDNNLDTMVRNIVNKCQCYDRFPIKKLAEGKYQVGRNAALIFVRVMRKHVMVRVGGGWDTFDHYITKHDPCRTKVMGTIDVNGHSKSLLPPDTKLNFKPIKAEHTVATSTDNSSMCSSSSDGSEGICRCEDKARCNHRISRTSGDTEINNENNDPTTNFTRSIEEIDKKLKLLENRRPSLDMSMKDPMVYDNKSDRWLRSHLNTIKQHTQPTDGLNYSNPQANFKMLRGHTADNIDRQENKHTEGCSRTPKALRRKSNTGISPKGQGKQSKQRELSYSLNQDIDANPSSKPSYDSYDAVDNKRNLSPVSSLDSSFCSIKSEPTRRSCNDMSTQTEFNDEIKSSKIPRSMLRVNEITSSKIPRPVMNRSKTFDAIPLRKKKSANNTTGNASNATRDVPVVKPHVLTERPNMRREKSDIPTSMRREKSNLTGRSSKHKQTSRGPTTTASTPNRKDRSRAEPVRIRNGPELRV